MLQQTQVDRVMPKYRAFLERFPTLRDLAGAPAGEVIRAWAGLGYNRRALNLQRTAQAVLDEHGGRFPDSPQELARLPGIGPYTAGAVACFAFERDVAFMDTNIRRVIGRVFVGPEDAETWRERELLRLAQEAVPRGQGYRWNQAVMELGALICTSSRPRCGICPLRAECHAYSAWREADERVFQAPSTRRRPARAVAERPASYQTSNRYFRGRLVAALRELPVGDALTLRELGPRLKDGWTEEDLPWLDTIARGLAEDGLIVIETDGSGGASARLP
jgi:A/G-specific adenine glycosylase